MGALRDALTPRFSAQGVALKALLAPRAGCQSRELRRFTSPGPAGTTTASKYSTLGVCSGLWPCWQPQHPEPLSSRAQSRDPISQSLSTAPNLSSHTWAPREPSHPWDPIARKGIPPSSPCSAPAAFPRWDPWAPGTPLWKKGPLGGSFSSAEPWDRCIPTWGNSGLPFLSPWKLPPGLVKPWMRLSIAGGNSSLLTP